MVIIAVWLGTLKGMDIYCQTSWGEVMLVQEEGPDGYGVNLSLLGHMASRARTLGIGPAGNSPWGVAEGEVGLSWFLPH